MLTVERYRKTRFWALYEAGQLLCVTVYKKGASAVRDRIERGAPTTHVPDPAPSARPESAARRHQAARVRR